MLLAVREVGANKVLGSFSFSGGEFHYPDKRVLDIAQASVELFQDAGWTNEAIASAYADSGWSNGYVSIGKR